MYTNSRRRAETLKLGNLITPDPQNFQSTIKEKPKLTLIKDTYGNFLNRTL